MVRTVGKKIELFEHRPANPNFVAEDQGIFPRSTAKDFDAHRFACV